MKDLKIYVESEFAPLKRVVLAQSEFCFPEAGFDEASERFLTEDSMAAYDGAFGVELKEFRPDLQAAWEKEKIEFRRILEKHGVEVLRPRLLTKEEKEINKAAGYANFFCRDPFFVVGDKMIEANMKLTHRINEIFPIQALLQQEAYQNQVYYVGLPTAKRIGLFDQMEGPFLEGGDVLVLGKEVFVGNSGLASNHAGIKWLRNLLSFDGYTVTEIPLHPHILHLDCALSFVNEQLLILCEEAFLDGVPERFFFFEKINVTLHEAQKLITNGLPINESTYVMDPAFIKLGKQLEEKGILVEYVDYQISRSFGGSFRCTTQPLLRKK